MIGVGVGIGIVRAAGRFFGGPSPSLPSGSNPNLFLFPEDFTNAAWLKPAITITADYGDPDFPTADQLVIPTPRLLVQTTTTAGTAGSGGGNISITAAWAIYSLTATVDGLPYTLTAKIISLSGSTSLRLEIVLSGGGFIQGRLENQSGGPATIGLAWMKLEQSSSFSGYP